MAETPTTTNPGSQPPQPNQPPKHTGGQGQMPALQHWADRHVWQIQPVRDGLLLASAFGLVWLGYRLSLVTVPMLLALTIAYLMEPIVRWVTGKRLLSRPGAAIGVIALSALVIVVPLTLGVGFGVAQGVQWGRATATKVDVVVQSVRSPDDAALADRVPKGAWRKIRDFAVEQERKALMSTDPALTDEDFVGPPYYAIEEESARDKVMSQLYVALSWAGEKLKENAETIGQRVIKAGGGVVGGAVSIVGSLGKFIFSAVLTAFFFYFFCTGWGQLLRFAEGMIPERKRGKVFYLLGRMDKVIAGFVRGRVTVCACLVIFYTLAYWIIGVPAPFVLGPITGLLTLVPYAAGLSAPVAMLMMWLDPAGGVRQGWWWIIGAPLVVLFMAQAIDDWVLTPSIQGKATNMDVPTILFASIAGGVLAGVYGLLLAIPVAACLKILAEELLLPRIRAWAKGEAHDLLPMERH